jgi:hypothetical protein
MKTKEDIPWKCTDPDNHQYGRRLSTYKFEFAEFNCHRFKLPKKVSLKRVNFNDPCWILDVVDLEEYTMKEIMKHTEGYYDNLDEIAKQYGKDFTWIVAECIFEQDSGLY